MTLTAFRTIKLFLSLALILRAGLPGPLHAETAREKILAAARQERDETAQHPYPFRSVPVYDVVSPDTVAGTGFIVSDGTRTLAVTAKHPHPKTDPTEFMRGTNHIRLLEKVYDADDILAFKVEAPGIVAFHLIPAKSRLLYLGDELSVVGYDYALTGQLELGPADFGPDETLIPGQPVDGKLQLRIPAANDLTGFSGAPIILNKTGEVIGVLVGAVELRRETIVDFRLFPAGSQPQTPALPVESIFSLKTMGRPAGNIGDTPQSIMPASLFALRPGVPITNLLNERPFLQDIPIRSPGKSHYLELLPKDCLFSTATFTVENGRTTTLEMLSRWPGPTALGAEALFSWFFSALGQPAESFSFGEHRDRPGQVSVYCQWTNEQASVILGVSSPDSRTIYLELLAHPSTMPRENILQPSWSTPISSDVESLRKELHRLERKP